MPLEAQSTNINGTRWTLSPLPAGKSLRMLQRLLGIIGGSLGEAAKEAEQDLGRLIERLCSKIADEPDFDQLIRTLLNDLVKDGRYPLDKEDAFNVEFGGKLMTLFPIVRFAIEVNYGDFLSVLSANGAQGLGKMIGVPSKKPQPQESQIPPKS